MRGTAAGAGGAVPQVSFVDGRGAQRQDGHPGLEAGRRTPARDQDSRRCNSEINRLGDHASRPAFVWMDIAGLW